MQRIVSISLLVVVLVTAGLSGGQNTAQSEKIDPLALKVLKAVIDPIASSRTLTFRALVAEEHLGTNGQAITRFRVERITLSRPDKLRIEVKRAEQQLEFYLDGGKATLYSPKAKLFTTMPAPKTVDAALKKLADEDISFVFSNVLESDPYKSLTDDLKSAYVIGRTEIQDQTVHHLAFTDPNAEWQLWVKGGEEPRLLRAEIIDTATPQRLRTTVTFLEWDLNPQVQPSVFVFEKPSDAHEIELARESNTQRKPEAKQ